MTINIILLTILLMAALWTAMSSRIVRAAVGLAVTSVILSIIMFQLKSPLAAVFELSVCAGLIFVIFIITISFAQRMSKEMLIIRKKEIFSKFWCLPVILIIAGIALSRFKMPVDFVLPLVAEEQDVRNVLWNVRHLDLLGQIIVLLAGAFSVVVFFKEEKK